MGHRILRVLCPPDWDPVVSRDLHGPDSFSEDLFGGIRNPYVVSSYPLNRPITDV